MKKLMTIVLALTFISLMASLGGCTRRAITMTSWWENYVYVGYWEGKCLGGFCSKGAPKVQRCNINDDNSVTCVQEEALNAVLQSK